MHTSIMWWSMILFWTALFSFGIYLVSNFVSGGSKKDSPFHYLNERLAKGEIDEEEYKRIKAIIKQENSTI
ncbi:SHOCT domain-containing protein [Aquibacillus sediminis]|uniref:SHOCT domain-containing protein n=1 Tax=Aquibacillus sediminis TaxID=2574734 RepID=UPI001108A9B0|nr:SHOCT domain-containing protein [Aquibacillus sediminis]